MRAEVLALLAEGDRGALARALSLIEETGFVSLGLDVDGQRSRVSHVIGITGPPGVGKSSLISALVASYRERGLRVAVLAIDPSSPVTGGALLGDRIRMARHSRDSDVFIRSLAHRGRPGGVAAAVPGAIEALSIAGFERILLETVGVGQTEMAVCRDADTIVLVTAPGLGDSVQAEKAGIMEVADVFVVNKGDREGAAHTARALAAMLRLGDTGAWRPPVVDTEALSGVGIADLVASLDLHSSHRDANSDNARRQGQILDNAAVAVVDALGGRVAELASTGEGQALLRRLVFNDIDLGQAVSAFLSALSSESKTQAEARENVKPS